MNEPYNSSSIPLEAKSGPGGPSFTMQNRLERAAFQCVWRLLASWTPPQFHAWRCSLLRLFGARIGHGVRLYSSTRIWHPANLVIGDFSTIGPRVNIYNQGEIAIGTLAVVSQGSHLCASTHRVNDRKFQLVLKPISIGDETWIAADAFVGPGVKVGHGAVLGARGAAFKDLEAWSVYGGNPASFIKLREFAQ